ncbi:energy transducer TonB [Propionivibrio sp.]|uniref:energy transducer TonB n=1 Tax=Propionivibrio sp. TaxID=2212460 RepID=UPI0039E2DC50
MSAALFVHSGVQRSGLFGFVMGAHALLLVMLTLVRSPVPPTDDKVMMVEMLPMAPAAQESIARPPARPAAPPEPERPRPVRPKPAPAVKAPPPVPAPVAETAPAPAAPTSSTPPAPASEPAAASGGGAASGSAYASAGTPTGSAAQGGGESQARFDADYLRNPAPPYPPMSRKMREEGKVLLRVLVTPEGTAGSVEVKTSSGSARLDESALRTVRQWKFIPARRGDAPVQSWVLVPIIFKLEQ